MANREELIGKLLEGITLIEGKCGLWVLSLIFSHKDGKVLLEIVDKLEVLRGLVMKAGSNVGKPIEMLVKQGRLVIIRFVKGQIMSIDLDSIVCLSL